MTVTAVATEAFGRYCEASLSPIFSHVWVGLSTPVTRHLGALGHY